MKTTTKIQDKINIGLLRFANDTREMEARMVKFAETPFGNLLDLQLFQIGIAQDAAKGVLVMNNALTDISEDAMKILFSVAKWSYGEENKCLPILYTVISGLEEGEEDLEALYKFYEACRVTEIAFNICHSISGEGEGAPLMEACYLANPEMFEKLFTGPKWEFEYEEYAQDYVIKIFEENSKGEVIYQKLNELLTSKYPEITNDCIYNE